MSATSLRAVSAAEPSNPVPCLHSVILDLEKTIETRVQALAAEIFERAGRPTGKESRARLAAERQLLLSRIRLIECPDSITLFAFVPQSPARRTSIFLTSRGVAVRSNSKDKRAAAEPEKFLVARWATEIDPHTAYGTLDGNTLCLTGWHLDSPGLKSRFKLWSVSNSNTGGANPRTLDRPVLLKRSS
jgi:hypothetical protein